MYNPFSSVTSVVWHQAHGIVTLVDSNRQLYNHNTFYIHIWIWFLIYCHFIVVMLLVYFFCFFTFLFHHWTSLASLLPYRVHFLFPFALWITQQNEIPHSAHGLNHSFYPCQSLTWAANLLNVLVKISYWGYVSIGSGIL